MQTNMDASHIPIVSLGYTILLQCTMTIAVPWQTESTHISSNCLSSHLFDTGELPAQQIIGVYIFTIPQLLVINLFQKVFGYMNVYNGIIHSNQVCMLSLEAKHYYYKSIF